ncbi:selenium metabolism-associated LysR family transcriptional regulator [Desulfosporosinus shakirovi]|uniref:selenium metabolism-associated LysR family transcriptional regulator n=1 Tax=Desulfosporosinus shakirovi TaxID=2885154 RepID=UPI001E4A2E23|nr:selenium metabolism-associated LysR family transcriptional regulator [Desulfosporosinus sp. SRJS8]MCB8816670.1 LysR family transcriptional regulator [Desulfosporosinus sp. SRJS8]
MNLARLKTLAMVAQSGSISKAALELNLTQPAVTKHIQSLEEYYGRPLIDRSAREAVLTEEGQLLNRYVLEVLRLMYEAERALAKMSKTVQGSLRIGASSIPGQYILPLALGEFSRNYPEVDIAVEIGDTEQITRLVLENKVDLGLVGNAVKERQLECYPCAEDELVLILPPDHPLAQAEEIRAEDLCGEKMVWREIGSGTRKTVEGWLAQAGVKLGEKKGSVELGSTGAVVAAVEAGLGLSIVSIWAVVRPLAFKTLAVRRLKNLSMKRRLYVIQSTQNTRRPAQAFFDFILGDEGKCALDRVFTEIPWFPVQE